MTRSGNPILSSHNSPILAPRIGTCGGGLSSRKRPAKIIAVGWFPVGGRYPRCSPPIGPGWGRISSMYSLHALNCRSAGLGSGAGKSRRWCHGGRYPGPRRTASSLKAPPCRDQSVRALVVSGIRLRTLRREQARWHQRPPTHRRLTADSPPVLGSPLQYPRPMATQNGAAGTSSQVVNSKNPDGQDIFSIVRRRPVYPRTLCSLDRPHHAHTRPHHPFFARTR